MPELIGESLPKQLRDFGLLQGQAELTYTTQDLLLDADVFTQKETLFSVALSTD